MTPTARPLSVPAARAPASSSTAAIGRPVTFRSSRTGKESMSTTSGNAGLDALADAIAERVIARMLAQQEPPLMTVGEAAVYLSRGPGAVRGMIGKGILPSVRMGGRVMIRREDADRLIESSVTRA